MARTVLAVEKFKGLTELPEYGRDPGLCVTLTDYRVMPGGYLQCRDGCEKIKPSGGTAADPISSGIYTGAHQHVMTDGYIVRVSGGTPSTTWGSGTCSYNLAQYAWWDIFPTGVAQHDAIYIGSDSPFSRIVFYVGQGTVGAPTAPTFAYEYYDGTTAGAALTTTSTPNFFSTAEQTLEFSVPSNWAAVAVNNYVAYWVRIRVTNSPTALSVKVTNSTQKVYGDWTGTKQIWLYACEGTAANVGSLQWYGQSGTTVTWPTVSTSLFSGNYANARFASYKNCLYMVNGKEQKRYSGAAYNAGAYGTHALNDMGFTAPTGTTSRATGGTGLTGTFQYAITYAYGPAGDWGESNEQLVGATIACANQGVDITLTLTNDPGAGIVDKIYVYRTTDLTNVPATATDSFPLYRIGTISRGADGAWAGAPQYSDTSMAFPFPPAELDVVSNTPPSRCKHIVLHKNRLFLGSNNQYPGRVWWSDPFEVEAFNQDENYADFTRQTGGAVTGMVEFNDQVVVFTEDQMFGIANVDDDVPNIYVIHPGLGCVAPDAIGVSYGRMVWMARDGVYLWDGQDPPKRVSEQMVTTFGKMTVKGVGKSRAVMYDRMWLVYLVQADASYAGSSASSQYILRYDLTTDSWSRMNIRVSAGGGYGRGVGPLVNAELPVTHANAGERRPLFSGISSVASYYSVLVGDRTTTDDGANIYAVLQVHLGPSGRRRIKPERATVYYTSVTSPAISIVTGQIGYDNTTVGNDTAEDGADYSKINAVFSQSGRGAQDIRLQFLGTPAGSAAQIYGVYLEGDMLGVGPKD